MHDLHLHEYIVIYKIQEQLIGSSTSAQVFVNFIFFGTYLHPTHLSIELFYEVCILHKT